MPVGNEAKKLVAQNSAAKQTSNNVKFEKKSVETNKDVNFYLNNNKSANTQSTDGTLVETIEYEDGTTSVKTINKYGSYKAK